MADQVGGLAQYPVTDRVAKAIIDLLEAIEIEHRNRQGRSQSSRALYLRIQSFVEIAPVGELREWILATQSLQFGSLNEQVGEQGFLLQVRLLQLRGAGAHALFEDFVRANPTHEYADNAYYWMGECFYGQTEFALAIGEFQKVAEMYPGCLLYTSDAADE